MKLTKEMLTEMVKEVIQEQMEEVGQKKKIVKRQATLEGNSVISSILDWPVKLTAKVFEYSVGATYPTNLLLRRLNLLSPQEQVRVEKLSKQIESLFEQIDEIIATRAEKEEDSWG